MKAENNRYSVISNVSKLFLLLWLVLITSVTQAAPAGVDWQWVNPKPQGNPYNAVAHNTLGFTVAVGDLGNVVSSSDAGVNWAVQSSNTTKNLNAIYTDVDTAFIAVGDGGTIITEIAVGSPPQLTGIWIDFTDGSLTANLNGIVKGNVAGSDLFVAVGDNGAVLTNDGSSLVWTAASSVPAGVGNLTAVVWNGSIFVAVSDNGTIIASPNGTSWTKENFVAGGFVAPHGFRAVNWNGLQFVAVGDTGLVETSTNGASWADHSFPPPSTPQLFAIAWNGSKFIATSKFGRFYNSADGFTWSSLSSTLVARGNLLATIWDGTQFVVAGDGATLLTTTDGSTWARRYPQTVDDGSLTDVIWSPTLSRFLVASRNIMLLSSADGILWTSSSGLFMPFSGIADNGSLVVAVAEDGKPYTSTTGTSWQQQATDNTNELLSIIWDGSQFVSVGVTGTIVTSVEGLNWTVQASGTAANLFGVASNGTTLVTVGNSVILTSPDGGSWVSRSAPLSTQWNDVVWNDSKFVVVGFSGKIMTSTDGVTWVAQTSGVTQSLFGISWDGQQFIAAGGNIVVDGSVVDKGVIITSPDGISWTSQESGTTNLLRAIASNGTRLVAVGSDGTILISASTNSIGGSVSGLTGSGLELQNNATDNLTIASDGTFTFATALATGSTYDVTVSAQPAGQTCTITNGSGTLSGANISDVAISCSDIPVATGSGGGGGSLNVYWLILLSGLAILLRKKHLNIAKSSQH